MMMNSKIVLVGGGGHCKSVLDSLLLDKSYSEICIVDKKENIGKKILGITVIGCDDDLPILITKGFGKAFITVGSIGNPSLRRDLFILAKKYGYQLPNIFDPSASLSKNAKLSEGIFIGKNAVVNAGSVLMDGVIINTGAIIEHDCEIRSFAHIAPGSVLGGGVIIGANTHIGSNSVVKQELRIGSDTVIGMGSVVTKDMESNSFAYGNPCKKVGNK